MKVLKDLSREFDIDPYPLRMILRKQFGKREGKNWRWEDNDPELKKILDFLKQHTNST